MKILTLNALLTIIGRASIYETWSVDKDANLLVKQILTGHDFFQFFFLLHLPYKFQNDNTFKVFFFSHFFSNLIFKTQRLCSVAFYRRND